MGLPCLKPLPLYQPRDPQASDLWRLLDGHFATFREVYSERFQAKYGFWRPVIDRSVEAFLKCGDLHEGFARVRCPDCKHEMFVAYAYLAAGGLCPISARRQNRTGCRREYAVLEAYRFQHRPVGLPARRR